MEGSSNGSTVSLNTFGWRSTGDPFSSFGRVVQLIFAVNPMVVV